MERPRKVTVLIDSLIGGGAERIAVEAAAALDPNRYVAHLLVTRQTGSLAKRVHETGLQCTILNRRRGFHPRLFAQASRLVAAGDIVHAHKFSGSAWGALLAQLNGRPLIAHEHTFDGARSLQRSAVYRGLIAPVASRILCVSEGVAVSLRAEGIAPSKIEVVENGVLVDDSTDRAAARAELGLPTDQKVVGMVARLRPEKRHALALEALALLRAGGGEEILCLVGDGPLAGDLRVRARELGIEEAVVWSGEQPNAQRLMQAFDVLLLCSSFEGMPLAVLEALLSGIPVVSTAVGSLPDLLAGGGGLIVEDERAESIADGLKASLGSTSPSSSVFRNGLRERYGIGRLARDLQRVYDEAIVEVR